MNKRYFIELLKKYEKGKASPRERHLLYRYYDLFENETGILSLLTPQQKEQLKREIEEGIWQQVDVMERKTTIAVLRRWAPALAAAAIGGIILTLVFLYNTTPHQNNTVNTAVNQIRENRLMTLPDGSSVIVYAGSTLRYFSSIENITRREVYLEGQAYFDIRHDPAKPFIVHTGDLNVTVLGTAFNVKAVPSDPEIAVTVTRGKVQVSNNKETLGIVTRSEQLIFNKAQEKSNSVRVNTDQYLNWKRQDLYLDDITVAEAAGILEDWFDVRIFFKDSSILSNRFTTLFTKGERLDQLLNSICEFNNAKFTYDAKKHTVVIMSKTDDKN
jgi:transmembrane sensor